MNERRKHQRWFLSTNLETHPENRNDSPGHLLNISLGGFLLMARFPIQTNIVMPMTIKLDKDVSVNEELRVVTQIVRSEKGKDDELYGTGCKLINLDNDSRKIIERIIELYRIN